MLNFLGEFVASVLILLTILLAFGTDEFCVQYHDEMLFLYMIFVIIGFIIYILYEIFED